MRQGCLLAFTVFFLMLAVLATGAATFLFQLGAFESWPVQSSDEAADADASVLMQFNFQAPGVRPMLEALAGQSPGARTRFLLDSLPHEATVSIAPDAPAGLARLTVAVSLARLSGLLSARSETELWRWVPGQKVESASLESPGLWGVRSVLPVVEDRISKADSQEPMATSAPEDSVITLRLDNRFGAAHACLKPVFDPALQPGERPLPVGRSSMSNIPACVARLRQADAWVRLDAEGAAQVEFRISANDENAATALMALLEVERDRLSSVLESRGGRLEGHWSREGLSVIGSFRIPQAAALIRPAAERTQP